MKRIVTETLFVHKPTEDTIDLPPLDGHGSSQECLALFHANEHHAEMLVRGRFIRQNDQLYFCGDGIDMSLASHKIKAWVGLKCLISEMAKP